jgi:hypothetical protein
MKRLILAAVIVLTPVAVPAEQAMRHSSTMNHSDHMARMDVASGTQRPPLHQRESGQSAFGAIQEIVAILEADPHTDWSKVDIETLRQHLIDMNNITLDAAVVAAPVDNGARFAVTGIGKVVDSIRRMVIAHAQMMIGADGWTFAAAEISGGATLTVTVTTPADIAKVRALGFIGVMAQGAHHQAHHLMIAAGQSPHH